MKAWLKRSSRGHVIIHDGRAEHHVEVETARRLLQQLQRTLDHDPSREPETLRSIASEHIRLAIMYEADLNGLSVRLRNHWMERGRGERRAASRLRALATREENRRKR